MPPLPPLGIAFFGAGDVSDHHAEAVRRCADARLVGLWNRTPERGKEKADGFGCRTYDSPEELLADPAVEAVSVLTNLETHLEFATRALEAGKHVLVEKPVGVTVNEIETMRDLARQKNVQRFVRREISEGVNFYSSGPDRRHKHLLICFAGLYSRITTRHWPAGSSTYRGWCSSPT